MTTLKILIVSNEKASKSDSAKSLKTGNEFKKKKIGKTKTHHIPVWHPNCIEKL